MPKPTSKPPTGPIGAGLIPKGQDPIAFFQQWFCDSIPHNLALKTRVISIARGKGIMQLDWAEHLVGNPDTGILAGGAITALLDSCCGMSVATRLDQPITFATLDLRIDYARPAEPSKAVIAEAECYRITTNVAFTRAIAHQGDPNDPVAAAAGTFMLQTKGPPPGSMIAKAGAARTAKEPGP